MGETFYHHSIVHSNDNFDTFIGFCNKNNLKLSEWVHAIIEGKLENNPIPPENMCPSKFEDQLSFRGFNFRPVE